MKHIKKFDDKKKSKSEETEIKFDATSLVDKDQKPGFKTEVEDNEEVQKEFKKLNKVKKFEAFIDVHIDNIENVEVEYDFDKEEGDDENEMDAEYEEDDGCGCCGNCTNQPGCECGCENCNCKTMEIEVVPATQFLNNPISEKLKWHLENNRPVTENIFRPGSEAFYEILKETRKSFDSKEISLCQIDKEIFESTNIGQFAYFQKNIVPLDLPMENMSEINEAEYKGKEVKLNYPMRNSGGGKKYYVYVKNPKSGNIMKISFGDVHGGLTAKVSNPEARKSFAARHKCSTKKDKTKAGYWACRINRYGHLWNGRTYPGYW